MIKKIILSLAVTSMAASPAFAAQAGLVIGGGSTSSSSSAQASSVGSSGSMLLGTSRQQSSAGVVSSGVGAVSFNGPNVSSVTANKVDVAQQGTTSSIGLAGSHNANVAVGGGTSSATGGVLGGWVFYLP